ncbi:MAG TPA: type 2 lanthipeptide synthetase LanM family protein [Thermoanaerobaculia bacterium]|nr:type 2 lanthipeptide synthetase LanM family protein [Thermoanaerobaculia bacterium]
MSSSTALSEDAGTLEEGDRSTAELLGSSKWYLAATLAERVASWRRAGSPRHPIDYAVASQRLERWKTQSAFTKHPGLWDERLEAAGIREDELLYLLGETADDVRARSEAPAWLAVIEAAYGDGGRAPEFAWAPGADLERCRFMPLLEPLIHHYHARLDREARELHFPPEIARALTSHLPDDFAAMLNRTSLVEMHVLKLEEQLEGETPEARFQDFLGKLRDKRYALEVLERYPVLARQIVLRFEHWLDACVEFLRRLAADEETIAEQCNGGRPLGTLRDVYGGLSDFHRGGRSVFILAYDSGFQVVYKPKPLGLEVAFQQLLAWINERGFEPPFRQAVVIDRGDYGWMEMLYTAPCEDDAALRRFLERQGGYLALLYVLDGTDFHHENLLAAGEHPMLLDLETLFQPWLNVPDLQDVAGARGAPLRATVLRTNLLPERSSWGDKNAAGVDISGFTAQEGQLMPRPMLAATDGGRDTMRMQLQQMRIPAGESRARVAGRQLSVMEFAQPLEAGFRRLYALLAANTDTFLDQLDRFAGSETRLLFRNTMQYSTVLLESFHPHALGNALERDRLYDSLWLFHALRPFLRSIAEWERADLHNGDIPLFVTDADSRDALHWRGERLTGFFADSGIERARRRVRELSPVDCERQVAVIRDSFEALRVTEQPAPRASYELVPRPTRPQPEELLALARQAADRILERSFANDREAHWLTLDYRDPNGWQVVPATPDLYRGLPGIAFFLGYLGAATGETRYTDVARKALFAQKRQIAADPKAVNGVGAFNGWGGVIYALAHLGRLWNDAALLDEAESYARLLPELIAQDELLDVVAGSAGAICSLAALGRGVSDPLMLACGERLLAKAEAQQRGHGWRMPIAGDRALAGLSHGAAGIALALLRLYGRTGDQRFRDAAIGGMEFERSLFSEAEQNWPDLREGADEGVDSSDGHHYMLAWCHGAPGIGLARLAGLPWVDDAEVRREIDVAVRSTLAGGFGENHSLCHGDLGNLELLFAAARLGHDAELEERAWRIAGGIADSIRKDGWLFGLPGDMETPGLMAGLAGTGYALARLARPDFFPDVLTLEP